MDIGTLVRRDLVNAIMPHVCAAIAASPCTCADPHIPKVTTAP